MIFSLKCLLGKDIFCNGSFVKKDHKKIARQQACCVGPYITQCGRAGRKKILERFNPERIGKEQNIYVLYCKSGVGAFEEQKEQGESDQMVKQVAEREYGRQTAVIRYKSQEGTGGQRKKKKEFKEEAFVGWLHINLPKQRANTLL